MGEKIALGFHICVDYELVWDVQAVVDAIKRFDIHDSELVMNTQPDNERDLWLCVLAYLKQGTGGEILPETNDVCQQFAAHFDYNVTLGGTAARAAIAIANLGYSSALQLCCFNPVIKKLLPEKIDYYAAKGGTSEIIYPHIILSYHGGARIAANDIDFVTSRENRVMISRDVESLKMRIDEDFWEYTKEAKVFLSSCFSQVLEFEQLKQCMKNAKALFSHFNEDTLVIYEDGHYVKSDYRKYVHRELAPYIDVISMNEDELQDYTGHKISILDPDEVFESIKYCLDNIGVETIIVHSSTWALAYGKLAYRLEKALQGGIDTAATRFRCGDDLNSDNFNETKAIKENEAGARFAEAIVKMDPFRMRCVPCRDLSFVTKPTVVGLGDSFVGGMLPGIAE